MFRRPVRPSNRVGLALPLALLLGGCVSPPERIDRSAEIHAADDPAALLRIGDAAASSGDMASATSFYRRATELRPGNADAALSYARSLASSGHADDAITALQTAHAQAGGNDRLRVAAALGKLLVLEHRPTEAVAVFREALTDGPATSGLLIGLGVALDASRDFPAAQAAYRQAISLEPNSVAAHNNLALSIALQGDTAQALALLHSLRDHVAETGGPASSLETVDGNLALVYAMRGNMQQARAAEAGTVPDRLDQVENMRFYATLAQGAPVSGAAESSGLLPAAPAD